MSPRKGIGRGYCMTWYLTSPLTRPLTPLLNILYWQNMLDKKKSIRPKYGAFADQAKKEKKAEEKKAQKKAGEEGAAKHKKDLQVATILLA